MKQRNLVHEIEFPGLLLLCFYLFIAIVVFVAGWTGDLYWILTREWQSSVIRSKYVQVLLNQDMGLCFFLYIKVTMEALRAKC